MRMLRPDFARPSAWPRHAAYAAAVTLLAASAWQGVLAERGYRALLDQRARTAELQSSLGAELVRLNVQQAPASAPSYERDARSIARMSSFDVGGVLRSVESAQVAGAKVINLDVDASTRTAALTLDVASASTATAYVEALNAGDDRPKWTLARLQTQGTGDSAEVRAVYP
jgi:hypothetical protein